MSDKVKSASGPITEFFAEFVTLVEEIGKAAADKASDDDQRAVIVQAAAPVPGQIREMGSFVERGLARASTGQIKEAEQALRMANPGQMFKSGRGLFGNIGSVGAPGPGGAGPGGP